MNKEISLACGNELLANANAPALADEVRQVVERQDGDLLDVILATEERDEPRLETNVYCPLCQGDTIQIVETSEGDSERAFFQMHCMDCGCDFVLLEDNINACRRGIENAQKEINYAENKIKYFKRKMEVENGLENCG